MSFVWNIIIIMLFSPCNTVNIVHSWHVYSNKVLFCKFCTALISEHLVVLSLHGYKLARLVGEERSVSFLWEQVICESKASGRGEECKLSVRAKLVGGERSVSYRWDMMNNLVVIIYWSVIDSTLVSIEIHWRCSRLRYVLCLPVVGYYLVCSKK